MGKRIYVMYTGGTIGMQRTSQGYAPAPGLQELLSQMLPPALSAEMPSYTIHEYEHLIDSANMRPRHWLQIAQDVEAQYSSYDGFVILHGTDTMAFTSSALSFLLRGLRKPVIVTGSQIPLREMRNDARNNLLTALILAVQYPVAEVSLYFNGRLMRGNRATKVQADGFDAFDSPNFPLLGRIGIRIDINSALQIRPPARESFELVEYDPERVVVLKLFPGFPARLLRDALAPPTAGAVLETYGVGNAPDDDPEFLAAMEEATARGVVVVNVSQCLEGGVAVGSYAAGAALTRAGVVSGLDMTTEAAFAKLHHLLALGWSAERIRSAMQDSLCGECTPTDP